MHYPFAYPFTFTFTFAYPYPFAYALAFTIPLTLALTRTLALTLTRWLSLSPFSRRGCLGPRAGRFLEREFRRLFGVALAVNADAGLSPFFE